MQNTIGLVRQYQSEIIYPTEPDWNQFTIKLNTRLAELRPDSQSPVLPADYRAKLFKWLRAIIAPQPAWVPSLAAITTVVLLIFQGAMFSGTSRYHTLFKYHDTKGTKQVSSSYQNTVERRIAITKYVFEQTNS